MINVEILVDGNIYFQCYSCKFTKKVTYKPPNTMGIHIDLGYALMEMLDHDCI
jgi:hypothetical protein